MHVPLFLHFSVRHGLGTLVLSICSDKYFKSLETARLLVVGFRAIDDVWDVFVDKIWLWIIFCAWLGIKLSLS